MEYEKYNKILIIGYPGSGKTTLFNDIGPLLPDHYKVQTDSYKDKFEYRQQLYELMKDIEDEDKWLVEGIQGYRLLRKYAQLHDNTYKPDLIIICESVVLADNHKKQAKGLDTILDEYFDLEQNLPEIEEVNVFA